MVDRSIESILQELKRLREAIEKQNARISILENALLKPTYEYCSSLTTPASSAKEVKSTTTKRFSFKVVERFFAHYGLPLLGIGIFLIGMGFFISYSIQVGWLNPLVRVGLGVLCGMGLIIAAELLQKRHAAWSFVSLSGGLILLYLSVYAAFDLYKLMAPLYALIAFIGVTLLACFYALRHNSRLIAFISLVGAYTIPAFLHYQSVQWFDVRLLAGYLIIVAVGYMFMSELKNWAFLALLSFIGLLGYYSFDLFKLLDLNGVIFFLGAVVTLYVLVPVIYGITSKHRENWLEVITVSLAGLFSYGAIYQKMMFPDAKYFMFFMPFQYSRFFLMLTSGFILFYLLGYAFLFLLNRSKQGLLNALLVTAYLFIALMIQIYFGLYYQAIAFSMLSALLFIFGAYFTQLASRILAYIGWTYVLLMIVQGHILKAFGNVQYVTQETVALFVALATIIAGIFVGFKHRLHFARVEQLVLQVLPIVSVTIPAFWFVFTLNMYAPWNICGLAMYAGLLFVIGLYVNSFFLRTTSYWIFGIAFGLFVFRYKYNQLLHPDTYLKLNMLYATFAGVVLTALILTHTRKKMLDWREQGYLIQILSVVFALLIFSWGCTIIILNLDQLSKQSSFFLQPFMGYEQPKDILVRSQLTEVILTIYYGIFAVLLLLVGLMKRLRFVRYLGILIVILMLYKLFFIIMALEHMLGKIIAFLSTGILLIGASFLYQKMYRKLNGPSF